MSEPERTSSEPMAIADRTRPGTSGRFLFRKDFLGCNEFLKRLLMMLTGLVTYPGYVLLNRMSLSGTEHLAKLPDRNVLFVSNHQTYFADVIALFHVFCSVKWGFHNSIKFPIYLFTPKVNSYYVAAEETMSSGILPRVLAYGGSVSIRRTWREAEKNVQRQVKLTDYAMIGTALENGWVVTFPQGTTTPYAKGRRGTAHIIRRFDPVVVPVVIDGFREAFHKKGLRFRKLGIQLSIRFKAPLEFNETTSADDMLQRIMGAIEQLKPDQESSSSS
jgi:1-acyl-sn-glycerol-3-phosphate acyltransferase